MALCCAMSDEPLSLSIKDADSDLTDPVWRGWGCTPTSLKDPVLPHTRPCSLWPAFSLKCRCYLLPPDQHSLWVTAINSLLGKPSSNPKARPGFLCSTSTACPE